MPTLRMKEVEDRYGKPIKQVLKDLFEQHGNMYRVANALGCSQSTVSMWLLRLNMEVKTVVIEKQPEMES